MNFLTNSPAGADMGSDGRKYFLLNVGGKCFCGPQSRGQADADQETFACRSHRPMHRFQNVTDAEMLFFPPSSSTLGVIAVERLTAGSRVCVALFNAAAV